MARSPVVHGWLWEGEAVGNSPGLQGLHGCCAALTVGTRQGMQASRSICESSACLCFKHSLHKMKIFPEFYGSF